MTIEIERRFLIKKEFILEHILENATILHIIQGYILNTKEKTIRIRIQNNEASLCCKKSISPLQRLEFEYSIPYNDALTMLHSMTEHNYIEKNRYLVYHDCVLWEIDYFLKENTGLILAEVEMETASQILSLPEWVGLEVTEDSSFTNASLAKNPFSTWTI